MPIRCLFCNQDVTGEGGKSLIPSKTLYMCKRCGLVRLEEEAAADFARELFKEEDKRAISITLRHEWERSGRRDSGRALTLLDIKNIVSQYRPINPIDKMDNALINFEKSSKYVGAKIDLDLTNDYPLYYCKKYQELRSICNLLFKEGFTFAEDAANPHVEFYITAKGYQKLREIKKPGTDSKQCFVAMWFTPGMNDAYEKAIKPAIEFKEEGEDTPRFEAVKIDNVEHIEDINDEIVAQIRRSRFMVCDLTGYRGGVYFEAGFAYGLGLDVIYTCRKDWTKEGNLKDIEGQEVKILYDDIGNEIEIKKEGVHFDLAHRNRIEWSADNLNDFRQKLENRIKAVIY
jgi:hypothetical protein